MSLLVVLYAQAHRLENTVNSFDLAGGHQEESLLLSRHLPVLEFPPERGPDCSIIVSVLEPGGGRAFQAGLPLVSSSVAAWVVVSENINSLAHSMLLFIES